MYWFHTRCRVGPFPLVAENNWGIRACGGGRLAAATSPSTRSFYAQSERAPAALVLSVRRFRRARVASGGWCLGVQWHGCLADIAHFRCTSVGLLRAGSGVVRWGVGKQGGGKGLVGERGEGGSGCVMRSM